MTTKTFLRANVKELKKHLETLYKLSLLNLSKLKRREYWLDENDSQESRWSNK